jgi:hypothetical protein
LCDLKNIQDGPSADPFEAVEAHLATQARRKAETPEDGGRIGGPPRRCTSGRWRKGWVANRVDFTTEFLISEESHGLNHAKNGPKSGFEPTVGCPRRVPQNAHPTQFERVTFGGHRSL